MERKLNTTFLTCLSPGLVVSTSATPWMSVGQEHSIVHLFPHTSPMSVMFTVTRRLSVVALVAWCIHAFLPKSFAATLTSPISTEFVIMMLVLLASFSWVMYKYSKATGAIVSILSTNCFDRNHPVSIECEETWSRVNSIYSKTISSRNDWIQLIACVAILVYLAWANNASATRLLYTRAFANCHYLVSKDPNLKPLVVEVISEDFQFTHNVDKYALNAHSFQPKFSEQLGAFYQLFCYPQRMMFYKETLDYWERCVASHQLTTGTLLHAWSLPHLGTIGAGVLGWMLGIGFNLILLQLHSV